jgi:8-oxo-dGTP pyrophosphatase MutT (NUDIX family)
MLIQEAGAIAIRRHRGRIFVLLIKANRSRLRVFPKGHMEKRESAEEAALRELKEEAGIEGRILCPAGVLRFPEKQPTIEVHYSLVLATGRVSKGEAGRDPIWVDPRVALSLLGYDDARAVLKKMLPEIDRLGPAVTPGSKGFEDMMRADFEHVGESLLRTEELGEKRVTFFITLVTATAGALGYFGEKIEPKFGPTWRKLAAGALIVLLLLGLQTLQRVVARNAASDGFKLRLNQLRRYFASGADETQRQFMAFDPDQPPSRKAARWPWTGKGGWLDTVVLVNALLVGAMVGVWPWELSPAWRIALIAATTAVAWLVIHWLGVKLQRKQWEEEVKRL